MKSLYEVLVKHNIKLSITEDVVDLDLPSGTLWCKCNLGANSEEEYGDYYSWGELKTKENFGWDNYIYGDKSNLSKYNQTDNKTILDVEDDVVTKTLGNDYYTPSPKQFEELCNNTNVEIAENKGVKGILFISKTNKSNYLFIPCSGYIKPYSVNTLKKIREQGETVELWTNNTWDTDMSMARVFYSYGKYSGNVEYEIYHETRSWGLPIRGVKNK